MTEVTDHLAPLLTKESVHWLYFSYLEENCMNAIFYIQHMIKKEPKRIVKTLNMFLFPVLF